jgi:hypothetical protein
LQPFACCKTKPLIPDRPLDDKLKQMVAKSKQQCKKTKQTTQNNAQKQSKQTIRSF